MLIRLTNSFKENEFQDMFIEYFNELEIEVDSFDELFSSMNDDKNLKAYIAYESDIPIGFIMFCIEKSEHWFIEESFGFIREFWIHPDYRQKKHGHKLLNACETYFMDHQIYKVMLTTDTAEDFYLNNGYTYSFSQHAKNKDSVFTKSLRDFVIKETDEFDLSNIMSLWNNGNVMKYVGFPKGLNIDFKDVEQWYQRISNAEKETQHYSIYLNNQFCGESFYSVDEYGYTALDIKLFSFSRKNNVAYSALSYVIETVFANTSATCVYVDPHGDNHAAQKLYDRLGFVKTDIPRHLNVADTFQIITKEQWNKNKGE